MRDSLDPDWHAFVAFGVLPLDSDALQVEVHKNEGRQKERFFDEILAFVSVNVCLCELCS